MITSFKAKICKYGENSNRAIQYLLAGSINVKQANVGLRTYYVFACQKESKETSDKKEALMIEEG